VEFLTDYYSKNTDADGSKDWDIPSDLTPGSDYRIKIFHHNDPTDFDFSDADFTIEISSSPTISITSPNGGENWQPGSFHLITFIDNITGNIKIDLYKGGVFDSEINGSTPSDGSTNWNIPLGTTPGSDYKIKITSVDDTAVFDFSDADFTIETSSPFINITSPNGEESWQPGSFHLITFTDNLTEKVKIDLYKGGVFDSVINDSTRSDGSTNWTIHIGITPGSDYKIKITSVDDATVFDFSDADFTIDTLGLPTISITSPNGGESWSAGSFHLITFTDNITEKS